LPAADKAGARSCSCADTGGVRAGSFNVGNGDPVVGSLCACTGTDAGAGTGNCPSGETGGGGGFTHAGNAPVADNAGDRSCSNAVIGGAGIGSLGTGEGSLPSGDTAPGTGPGSGRIFGREFCVLFTGPSAVTTGRLIISTSFIFILYRVCRLGNALLEKPGKVFLVFVAPVAGLTTEGAFRKVIIPLEFSDAIMSPRDTNDSSC